MNVCMCVYVRACMYVCVGVLIAEEDEREGEEEEEEAEREGGEREEDYDEMPQVVSFDVEAVGSRDREGERGGDEEDGEGRSRSNSETSSLYGNAVFACTRARTHKHTHTHTSAENVMREATATPSEMNAPSPQVPRRHARKNARGTAMATSSASTVSREPSSETEMVNYSSGEDGPGKRTLVSPLMTGFSPPDESDHMLTETLSQMESPSVATVRDGSDGGVVCAEPELLDSPPRLARLRKRVLRCLLEQLYLVEMAGGMRSICFMKVSPCILIRAPLHPVHIHIHCGRARCLNIDRISAENTNILTERIA